ncbi:MAG: CRISPR system Cascade subunit CasC [Firmicutes bacterium]|nr:CRISPR system Cascade subunit CasC [Bacillota bacterium]
MKVELHIIQNFPPSCLNRDDTNTPKDCEFGGERRARISSQCLKRAIREEPIFRDTLNQELGKRTKLIAGQLKNALPSDKQDAPETDAIVTGIITRLSAFDSKNPEKTKVLLFVGKDEVERMRNLIVQEWDNLTKAARKDAGKDKGDALATTCEKVMRGFEKTKPHSPDIALFGRMLAENPGYNIDAACQVAHAISTNRVAMELDYYTAMDDLQSKEEPGAGMIGVVGYNSSCFYRYTLVDIDRLDENLDRDWELTTRAVEAFIRAAVVAIPTGKQTSMAAQNLPEAIFAVVRANGAPASLANAFVKPVRPSRDKDLITASIEALVDYWERLAKLYGENGIQARAICQLRDANLKALTTDKVDSLDGLVDKVIQAVNSK